VKPKPRFKKRFSKVETDYFKSISAKIRELRILATGGTLKAQTPAMPYNAIDPQPGGHNALLTNGATPYKNKRRE